MFQLQFRYKQSKFREITKVGRMFEGSYIVIPEKDKPTYINILQIIGDTFQRIDNLYDAEDFYKKAAEVDPQNLLTLIRIKNNLEIRDEKAQLYMLSSEVEGMLTPQNFTIRKPRIERNQQKLQKLFLDGSEIKINLVFNDVSLRYRPLVMIVVNGRLIWDNYIEDGIITLPLESKPGRNDIEIRSLNYPLEWARLEWQKINGN